MVSGSDVDRRGFQQMLDALDKYHGLPNGMFSCDEHLAGRNPSQGSELCTVVETMYSLEQSLAILGDARIGDRLERIAFNALPGTFTDDMWAHQYDQEPNQVEVSLHRKPWTTNGPESNLYGLEPNFGCCTANFHQGWPKFAASLWMASHDGGLAAVAYSPCEVRTVVGTTPVHLSEVTEYPFRGLVSITVNPASGLSFPLRLRIPSWAEGAEVRVNGERITIAAKEGFAKIERRWKAGDLVQLKFPLRPGLTRGYNDSVSIDRGPLVFSISNRRGLGKAARPRHDRRLAGISEFAVELRPRRKREDDWGGACDRAAGRSFSLFFKGSACDIAGGRAKTALVASD